MASSTRSASFPATSVSDRRGACLAEIVRHDMTALATVREQIHQQVKVAFVLSLADGRPMIAGRGTAADGIIDDGGREQCF